MNPRVQSRRTARFICAVVTACLEQRLHVFSKPCEWRGSWQQVGQPLARRMHYKVP